MATSPLQTVLGRLMGVRMRSTGPGRFSATCPAHQDRHRSLQVDVREDGSILLVCHEGCPRPAVLAAMGLRFRDLFPSASAEFATTEACDPPRVPVADLATWPCSPWVM